MDLLWSPWRMEYMDKGGSSDAECFLCEAAASEDDAGHHVVHRARMVFVLLNAFPYNTGHLMIAPKRHVGGLSDLAGDERGELMEMMTTAIEVARAALKPDGFNAGVNLGRVAGAGVPGHLHLHVVPRWDGDTNFMPIVGRTKVLPEMLADTAAKLRPGFSGA